MRCRKREEYMAAVLIGLVVFIVPSMIFGAFKSYREIGINISCLLSKEENNAGTNAKSD